MSIYNHSFRLMTALLVSSSLFSATSLMANEATKKETVVQTNPSSTVENNSPIESMNKSTLLATVNGEKITLGDVLDAREFLPAQLRQVPVNSLLPLILNQLIDQKAVQNLAKKENLQNDPQVQKQFAMAQKSILQGAYLMKKVKPQITDSAIQQYYNTHYANQAPQKEAHIRHILVKSEAQAKNIIKELKAGGNFSKLAVKYSEDKAANSQNNGDLGWVKKDDLVPDFANAAFAMKPNTYSQTPVHTQFGWHIIQLLAIRNAPIPPLDKVKDEIRDELVKQGVTNAIQDAVKQSTVVKEEKTINDLSGQNGNAGKTTVNPTPSK